jgi:hypothetical protein
MLYQTVDGEPEQGRTTNARKRTTNHGHSIQLDEERYKLFVSHPKHRQKSVK